MENSLSLNENKIQDVPFSEPLRRGVTPPILINQIKNTVPFIFEPSLGLQKTPYLNYVLNQADNNSELSHSEYYRLCVSAHYTTVASFVPTDVDNQIRFRLWHPTLDLNTLDEMVGIVFEASDWDETAMTTRYVISEEGEVISGHNGEWLSIAVGAYGAYRKKLPSAAKQVAAEIEKEILRQKDVYLSFLKAKKGISLLKASAVIAHNLGDLFRVIEMWNLPEDDYLHSLCLKTKSKDFFDGIFIKSGEIYKTYMTGDNHRHFALRSPKCLRNHPDFLLPIGPFFDDWGKRLTIHPLIDDNDIGTIATALIDGWVFLEGNVVGYARALAGIENSIPGGLNQLLKCLPSRLGKQLQTGKLRAQISIPQSRFEAQWNQMAMKSST